MEKTSTNIGLKALSIALLLISMPLQADRISSGNSHNLVARGDGGQFVWGSDANGQLGDGLTLDALNPIPVVNIRYQALGGAVAVTSFGDNNIVLLDDATLMGWGPNENNQLGSGLLNSGKFFGDTGGSTDPAQPAVADTAIVFPTEVVDPDGKPIANITAVSMGSNFTVALNQSGNVLVWGNLDAFVDRNVSREPINRFRDKFLDPTITFIDSKYKNGEPTQKYGLQYMTDELGNRIAGIVAVAAGDSHVLALTNTGNVLAWGENSVGQLADGTKVQRAYPVLVRNQQRAAIANITSISARGTSSYAVVADGRVMGWGSTGILTAIDDSIPDGINRPAESFAQRMADNEGVVLSGIRRLVVGGSHILGLTTSGRVNAWGSNGNGQLGGGTTSSSTGTVTVIQTSGQALDNIIEVSVGTTHSIALRADGYVYSWGSGESGELGDGTNIDSYYAVNVRNRYNGLFSLYY